MLKRLCFGLLGLLLAAVSPSPAVAQQRDLAVNPEATQIAIKGYDAVAYFTEGKATKGSPDITFAWQGIEWHFANTHHRDLFAADPAHYAPQFGEFCSGALTRGEKLIANPENWAIIDGKLYLTFGKNGIERFRRNPAENIKKAEAGWAEIQRQNQK